MVNEPVVTTLATAEPETVPIIALATTAALAGPPGRWPGGGTPRWGAPADRVQGDDRVGDRACGENALRSPTAAGHRTRDELARRPGRGRRARVVVARRRGPFGRRLDRALRPDPAAAAGHEHDPAGQCVRHQRAAPATRPAASRAARTAAAAGSETSPSGGRMTMPSMTPRCFSATLVLAR